MTRILGHAYNNGIVRSAVESRNLRAHARLHDVTFAESFRTCMTVYFAGLQFVHMVENATSDRVVVFERDMRNPSRMHLTSKNVALLYAVSYTHLTLPTNREV